ncbi:MAG TPA: RNA polymerase sigma factor region1.1 domain-containing protein, partial [Thermomicrobiales bacterium]|nr:RNA polymerase sigma factor region1.1 domain-containing protein [Thermomicrobiales bacterium]
MSASLIAKGKDQGFLLSEEIMAAFPNVESDVAVLDEFYSSLLEHGIEVVDQTPIKRPPPEREHHPQHHPHAETLPRVG